MELIKFDRIKMSSLFVRAIASGAYTYTTQHSTTHWKSCSYLFFFRFETSIPLPAVDVVLIIDKVSECLWIYTLKGPQNGNRRVFNE